MKPAPFDYLAPTTIDEALEALARHGDEAKILAGGQSLVPMLNMRLARPSVLVDINRVAALDVLDASGASLTVGALCRQRALERWATGRSPLIAEMMRHVSHLAIRTRGTVVGSIAHADPAAELPALLLALDGAVVARSVRGERVVASEALFLGPLTTVLGADELVTAVRFTLPSARAGWGFAEVSRRHGDFALVGALATATREDGGPVTAARLAFFGVGATPARGTAAERVLTGQKPTPERVRDAARAAAAALSPESDLHASADYRRRVAETLAARTLGAAIDRAGRGA